MATAMSLAERAQCLREGRQFCRVPGIEDAPHLFLILAEPTGELDLGDGRLPECLKHGELGGNVRRHRDRHHATPAGFRFRQRQTACWVGQQRQAECLFKPMSRPGGYQVIATNNIATGIPMRPR